MDSTTALNNGFLCPFNYLFGNDTGVLVSDLFSSSSVDNSAQRVPRTYLSPWIRQIRYGVRSQKERFRGTRLPSPALHSNLFIFIFNYHSAFSLSIRFFYFYFYLPPSLSLLLRYDLFLIHSIRHLFSSISRFEMILIFLINSFDRLKPRKLWQQSNFLFFFVASFEHQLTHHSHETLNEQPILAVRFSKKKNWIERKKFRKKFRKFSNFDEIEKLEPALTTSDSQLRFCRFTAAYNVSLMDVQFGIH